ncbi:MAG: hypothetical protein HN472_10070 [Nitrospina sp.]|jgi:hypothetical protein|nr:hypothetical protein [Nitrospina sp.]MBT4897643.1 hypothetical protein [Nitrospina sp.]MBT6596053.1 hypothetical protein [Nitrospina sp.]MBT6855569.1 hypothetical protein [Nitrospina sp.]MBT7934921.1 hypothetical protein [Nitrospina sp.]
MDSNNYKVISQDLDTLHFARFGYFYPDRLESSELIDKKVVARNKRDKPFLRMKNDIESRAREHAYCLMISAWRIYLFNLVSKNNNQFEADFSSATIQSTDDGKPDLKVASRKEVAYGNL